jgi:hypothetical protein
MQSTLIAYVDAGNVTALTQDVSCPTCDSSLCAPFSFNFSNYPKGDRGATEGCFTPVAECEVLPSGGNSCDLQVYLTLQGSDASGRTLFSSDARASQFNGFDLLGKVDFTAWNLNYLIK